MADEDCDEDLCARCAGAIAGIGRPADLVDVGGRGGYGEMYSAIGFQRVTNVLI